MPNFYCGYCGHKFNNVRSLTSCSYPRHPDGPSKGKHKLYEGTEKDEYTCKYCGHKFNNLFTMTGCSCPRHPDGPSKGKHSPAL